MNKLKLFLSIFMLSFLLVSCGNNVQKKDEVKKENSVVENKEEKVEKKGANLDESNLKKFRNQISLDDISKKLVLKDYKTKNKLDKITQDFINDLEIYSNDKITDNINGGIDKKFIEKQLSKFDKKLIRKFNLELNILDYKTKKKIEKGLVYVNGVKIGNFENGKFNGDFKWLKGIEKFLISVRANGYGDGFLVLNSINGNGSLLLGDISLKKSKEKEVILGKKQNIELNNTIIGLNECSIVDRNNKCINKKVKLNVNFISGNEANNLEVSLNRQAITKEGDIVTLASGGMAFIDFVGEDGEIYKLKKGEKIKISYKVNEEDIKNMKDKKYGNGEKNGYWWYDKNAGIWREGEANYNLDEKNKIWTIETSYLY